MSFTSVIRSSSALVNAVRGAYVVVCIAAIVTYLRAPSVSNIPTGSWIDAHPIAGFFLLFAVTQIPTVFDLMMRRKRIEVISAVYFGVLIGFLLSYLILQAIQPIFSSLNIGDYYRQMTETLVTLALTYMSVSLLLQTKDDFRFVIPYVEFAKEIKGQAPWILDSSALIDGRIADIVDTNIVDVPMIVPQFVLHEVQDIADSNDKMRRTRGRRGLEVLSKLQNNPKVEIRMHDTDRAELLGMSVDQRLVEVAKQLGGHVVTNDFNLNKVASVQGIGVINLNDLANALKPRYLPGERLRIKILKEGESQGQGVGYLDDGTMVVCEQAANLLGKDIDVIVTSVLQSSAGRMIFGRQIHSTNQ
ncbi:MAG: TRAM domain-containing protein [Planctomycetaceae bacterium]